MICGFCGSNNFKTKQFDIQSKILDKVVSYYTCSKCGSIIQHPYPSKSELEEYYNNYISIKTEMNPGYLTEHDLSPFFIERHKTLSEIGFNLSDLQNNRVSVELGCANGNFLKFIHSNGGVHITGVDISKQLTEEIDRSVFNVLIGSLDMLEDDSVDNLFAFNVLEHYESVESVVVNACRILRLDGNFVVEVPLAGTVSKYFGDKWRFLMPDEHLNIPSLAGLNTLMNNNGFYLTGITRFGSGLTTGMTFPLLKKTLDSYAKTLKFGDRGAFLFKKRLALCPSLDKKSTKKTPILTLNPATT